MLAVVIAGVLLGRANRGLSQNESSVRKLKSCALLFVFFSRRRKTNGQTKE